jgi:hypothetical protein
VLRGVDLLQIPDELKVYFWDVSVFVKARLLNEGNHKAFYVFLFYRKQVIRF